MFEYNTGFLFFSYFSIKCYFPGSLACLGILQILILNPTLLVPGYFCILISVLELSSEATVKPPANSLIPLGLALELCQVGLDQRSAQGGRRGLNARPACFPPWVLQPGWWEQALSWPHLGTGHSYWVVLSSDT